jgi:DNA-binding MarR family transcriptional regulator
VTMPTSPPPPGEPAVKASSTRLAAESWEALFRAQVALIRRFADDDVWDPISMREYDVLFTLSRCPDRRARLHELNREILLSQPSLSRMVDRLESAGFVAREPDPADRRGTLVRLTEEGSQMQRRIGRRHAASIRRYLGPALDDDELRMLAHLCDKLRLAQARIPDSHADPGTDHSAPM